MALTEPIDDGDGRSICPALDPRAFLLLDLAGRCLYEDHGVRRSVPIPAVRCQIHAPPTHQNFAAFNDGICGDRRDRPGLAWLFNDARTKNRALKEIQAHGGHVLFADRFTPLGGSEPAGTDWAPDWLKRVFGEDYFRRVIAIHSMSESFDDSTLRWVAAVGPLQFLDLGGSGVHGPGLAHLSGQSRLEELDLGETQIGDDALVHLGHLNTLKFFI